MSRLLILQDDPLRIQQKLCKPPHLVDVGSTDDYLPLSANTRPHRPAIRGTRLHRRADGVELVARPDASLVVHFPQQQVGEQVWDADAPDR
jgi:hypothetical protein